MHYSLEEYVSHLAQFYLPDTFGAFIADKFFECVTRFYFVSQSRSATDSDHNVRTTLHLHLTALT